MKAVIRKKYRIVETNAGKIAVQFLYDTEVSKSRTFRITEHWHLYKERFGTIKDANFFIDCKVEEYLDSEVKKVIK